MKNDHEPERWANTSPVQRPWQKKVVRNKVFCNLQVRINLKTLNGKRSYQWGNSWKIGRGHFSLSQVGLEQIFS